MTGKRRTKRPSATLAAAAVRSCLSPVRRRASPGLSRSPRGPSISRSTPRGSSSRRRPFMSAARPSSGCGNTRFPSWRRKASRSRGRSDPHLRCPGDRAAAPAQAVGARHRPEGAREDAASGTADPGRPCLAVRRKRRSTPQKAGHKADYPEDLIAPNEFQKLKMDLELAELQEKLAESRVENQNSGMKTRIHVQESKVASFRPRWTGSTGTSRR